MLKRYVPTGIDQSVEALQGRDGNGVGLAQQVDHLAFLSQQAHRLTPAHIAQLERIPNLFMPVSALTEKVRYATKRTLVS